MGNLEEELRKAEKSTLSGQLRLFREDWALFKWQAYRLMLEPATILIILAIMLACLIYGIWFN